MSEETLAKRSGGRSARIAKRSAPLSPESRPVQPGLSGGSFQPLSVSQMEKIFDSALELLEEVGMAQAIPEFIDLVTSNGGTFTSEKRLLFPRELVRSMIDVAAKEFTLFGFDEKHNLKIGGDRVHFSTGGAAVLILDHETSTFRDSQLKDIFNIGRIIDKSDNIHMYVRTVVARDMESSKDLDFNTAYAAMSSTTKPIGTSFFSSRSCSRYGSDVQYCPYR
jgi:trimethylamine--corrinoid protein Co-methyltransferase